MSLPLISISIAAPPTMPGLVADATRVWELNLYWPLHAQCGVWDPKGKGVDVWECIRPRESPSPHRPLLTSSPSATRPPPDHSTPGTQVCALSPFRPRSPLSALTFVPSFSHQTTSTGDMSRVDDDRFCTRAGSIALPPSHRRRPSSSS